MSSVIQKGILTLLLLSLASGCVSTGLIQSSDRATEREIGEVQIIGPVLRPQQIIIPESGTTIDRVIAESRRTERQLSVTEINREFIYVQRGITRVFVPTFMLNASSLGDMRIVPGDVLCAIPYDQTPISRRSTGPSATLTLKGLLTEQAAGITNADNIVAARTSDGEYDLTLNSIDAKPVPLSSLSNNLPNIGLQAGLSGEGFDIPAEIWVVRCVAEDGFIEEYVLPYRNEPITSNALIGALKEQTDLLKLKNGDILELTRIEFLPYAVEGQVISALSETSSVPGVEQVEQQKKKCAVEAGPLLQPLSAVLRNSAQQSSAVLRNSLKPATDLLRAQSGL